MIRNFFLVIIGLLTIIACSDTDDISNTYEVGSGFIPTSTKLIQIDTFEVRLSTFKFDSIETSNSERILIGQYSDEQMGEVKASSYMRFSATNFGIDDDAVLDSVALVLGYDNYFYSDTLKVNTLNFHYINEDFEIEDDEFYNTSKLSYEETPFKTLSYTPRPFEKDSVHISMTSTYTQSLFDAIRDDEIEDEDDLNYYFQGITIQPEITDNSVIGFSSLSTDTYLRFYYRIENEIGGDEYTYNLIIDTDNTEPSIFNNIQSDVSGLSIESLTEQEDILLAFENDNISYIQSGVGYATKIEFPTIRNIIQIPDDGVILSAILQIKPIEYSDNVYLADNLNLITVDSDNDIVDSEVYNWGTAVSGEIEEIDKEFNEVVYTFELGDYLTEKIEESPILNEALVIYHDEFSNKVDRLIIDQSSSNEYETKLIVNYAVYEND